MKCEILRVHNKKFSRVNLLQLMVSRFLSAISFDGSCTACSVRCNRILLQRTLALCRHAQSAFAYFQNLTGIFA
jgi:hypothetical protein